LSGGGDKEVVAEADRLEIKDKAPLILVEVLLDVKVLQQLKQYRNLFLRVSGF
jgi:translation initiation factor 5